MLWMSLRQIPLGPSPSWSPLFKKLRAPGATAVPREELFSSPQLSPEQIAGKNVYRAKILTLWGNPFFREVSAAGTTPHTSWPGARGPGFYADLCWLRLSRRNRCQLSLGGRNFFKRQESFAADRSLVWSWPSRWMQWQLALSTEREHERTRRKGSCRNWTKGKEIYKT